MELCPDNCCWIGEGHSSVDVIVEKKSNIAYYRPYKSEEGEVLLESRMHQQKSSLAWWLTVRFGFYRGWRRDGWRHERYVPLRFEQSRWCIFGLELCLYLCSSLRKIADMKIHLNIEKNACGAISWKSLGILFTFNFGLRHTFVHLQKCAQNCTLTQYWNWKYPVMHILSEIIVSDRKFLQERCAPHERHTSSQKIFWFCFRRRFVMKWKHPLTLWVGLATRWRSMGGGRPRQIRPRRSWGHRSQRSSRRSRSRVVLVGPPRLSLRNKKNIHYIVFCL